MSWAVVPNRAEIQIFLYWITFNSPLKVRLYKNDYTPGPTSVIGDFTQADFTGYAAMNWSPGTPVTDGAGKANVGPTVFDFVGPTAGAAQDVYGWYVTWDHSGDDIVMAGRFAGAPKTLTTTDDHAKFDLSMRMFDPH